MRAVLMTMILLLFAGAAGAQGKMFALVADDRLVSSGLIDYLIPRFSLKYGMRVTVLPAPGDTVADIVAGGDADAALAAWETVRGLVEAGRAREPRNAFRSAKPDGGGPFSIALLPDRENGEHAARFARWLLSDIGQRTITNFTGESVRYLPGTAPEVEVEVALPEGDAEEGERLSLLHCARCHVVSDKNRFGGIGSTPSFAAMRSIDNWLERFLNFWDENPHPSFLQVEGMTDPFDPQRPPHVAPIEITQDELAAIVAFAGTIEPKDLGAAIELR